ncbi:glycoside hydrolase family 19 protein [Pseudarcicella hirudinis]
MNVNVLDKAEKDKKIEAVWGYLGDKTQENHQATFPVTGTQLHEIFPDTPQDRCDEVAALLNKYSDKFEINTPLRMAHFLAQTGFESSGYTANKGAESGCYTSTNSSWSGWIARKTWAEPNFINGCLGYSSSKKGTKKFPWNSVDDVPNKYICSKNNPKETAEKNLLSYLYQCEGDNGDEESTDGYKYRGHGWIQLTWKKQYVQFNNWMKTYTPDDFKDVVDNSDLIGEDKTIDAISGMWYWQKENINSKADSIGEGCTLKEFKKITLAINKAALDDDKRKEIFDHAIKILK